MIRRSPPDLLPEFDSASHLMGSATPEDLAASELIKRDALENYGESVDRASKMHTMRLR